MHTTADRESHQKASSTGEPAEPKAGEFHGRSGAEWVLWRALRSRRPEFFRNVDPVLDEATVGMAV